MKAMVIRGFGGPEVFELKEMDRPRPGAGEVLVRVEASSVNPVDYKIRRAGSWAGIEPPAVIGYDVSGVVEETGPGVTDLRPGEEVYYTAEIFGAPGCYAEMHVASAAIVARKPGTLTHLEAACVPLAGATAWDALVTRAGLSLGETALIHGAAGGVGHFAVQIAKAAGAFVFATCGAHAAEFVRGLGADRVIDYRSEDFVEIVRRETGGEGVDFVLDSIGADNLARSLEVTRACGRLASIVHTDTGFSRAYDKNVTLHFMFLQRARYKLVHLRSLIERGALKPAVDSTFPLREVAEAHRRLEGGGVHGKVALQVEGGL